MKSAYSPQPLFVPQGSDAAADRSGWLSGRANSLPRAFARGNIGA
jgi:hypothetical protein